MKKNFVILTICMFFAGLIFLQPQTAEAKTTCKSLATHVKKFNESMGDEIGEFAICAMVGADIAAATGPAAPATLAAAAAMCSAAEITKIGVRVYNKIAAGKSGTIGPRPLEFKKYTGTLRGTFSRVFHSPYTISKGVGLRLKKRGGKGKAGFAFCSTDLDGKTKHEGDWTISGKTKSYSREWRYTGTNLVYLGIKVDGKSVGKEFQYEVELLPAE